MDPDQVPAYLADALAARATDDHPIEEWWTWLLSDSGTRTWDEALADRLRILRAGPLPPEAKRDLRRMAAAAREGVDAA